MLLVGGMFVQGCLVPVVRVEGRKVGIALYGLVKVGNVHNLDEGQGLEVQLATTDKEQFGSVFGGLLDGLLDAMSNETAFGGGVCGLSGDNDIGALGQGATDRLEGFATHNNGMP